MCGLLIVVTLASPDGLGDVMSIIGITLQFMQTIGTIATVDIDWPPELEELFKAMSAALFNFDIVAPECSADVGYVTKWYARQFV